MSDRVSKVLSESQVRAIKRAFDECGGSGGSISKEDFASAMQAVGITPTKDELREMLSEFEYDDITLADFISTIYYFLRESDTQEELIRAITVFDTDGDGKLEVQTVRSILTAVRHPLPQDRIDSVISKIAKDDLIDCVELVRELKPRK